MIQSWRDAWKQGDFSFYWVQLVPAFQHCFLQKKNLRESVNKIYLERKKTYSEADFRIKCNFLKANIIVDKILELYEKSGN